MKIAPLWSLMFVYQVYCSRHIICEILVLCCVPFSFHSVLHLRSSVDGDKSVRNSYPDVIHVIKFESTFKNSVHIPCVRCILETFIIGSSWHSKFVIQLRRIQWVFVRYCCEIKWHPWLRDVRVFLLRTCIVVEKFMQ